MACRRHRRRCAVVSAVPLAKKVWPVLVDVEVDLVREHRQDQVVPKAEAVVERGSRQCRRPSLHSAASRPRKA